jgi:hypothetical protein
VNAATVPPPPADLQDRHLLYLDALRHCGDPYAFDVRRLLDAEVFTPCRTTATALARAMLPLGAPRP